MALPDAFRARRGRRGVASLAAGFACCVLCTSASGENACVPLDDGCNVVATLRCGGASETLDAWRRPLGCPVLRRSAAERPAGDVMAIASWNTQGGGGDLERFVADLRAGRLSGGVRPDASVLLLQEVHRAGTDVPDWSDVAEPSGAAGRIAKGPALRRDIVRVARELDLHLFYAPSMRNGQRHEPGPAEDRGNAILSDLPLANPTALELPFGVERRVALAARVCAATSSGGLRCLLVASAHPDRGPWWHLTGAGSLRLTQARGLSAGLARRELSGPAILAGDFNVIFSQERDAAVHALEAAFGPLADGPDLPTTFGPGMDRRIDFMLRRELPALRYCRSREAYGSDHHPLVALLGAKPSWLERDGRCRAPRLPAPGR